MCKRRRLQRSTMIVQRTRSNPPFAGASLCCTASVGCMISREDAVDVNQLIYSLRIFCILSLESPLVLVCMMGNPLLDMPKRRIPSVQYKYPLPKGRLVLQASSLPSLCQMYLQLDPTLEEPYLCISSSSLLRVKTDLIRRTLLLLRFLHSRIPSIYRQPDPSNPPSILTCQKHGRLRQVLRCS